VNRIPGATPVEKQARPGLWEPCTGKDKKEKRARGMKQNKIGRGSWQLVDEGEWKRHYRLVGEKHVAQGKRGKRIKDGGKGNLRGGTANRRKVKSRAK